MKFSVGDPVYIKSNDEEGVIIEIIDKNTAKVRANNASYHAFFEDLEHPYLRWFLEKNKEKNNPKIFIDNIQKEKSGRRESALPEGVYLVFFPQYKSDDFDEVIDKIKIYLYNETDARYTFNYAAKNKQETLFEHQNTINKNSDFYIHDISFEEMASTPVFQYSFLQSDNDTLQFESFLTIKPKKLYENLHKVRHENSPFFSFLLFEKIEPKPFVKVNVEEIQLNPSSDKKNHFDFSHIVSNSKYEIDLHIEKLVSNPENLTSNEKLFIQLKEFENALELASVTHQRSIIFIHGIGKGKLKSEIHQVLLHKKQTKSIKNYVNNYDSRYGYGATEVFF